AHGSHRQAAEGHLHDPDVPEPGRGDDVPAAARTAAVLRPPPPFGHHRGQPLRHAALLGRVPAGAQRPQPDRPPHLRRPHFPEVRDLAVNAKQTMDTCAPVPNQHLVAQWLSEGGAESHVEVLREAYRERKLKMSAGLERHFPGELRATDPDGGFFLWVTFDDE